MIRTRIGGLRILCLVLCLAYLVSAVLPMQAVAQAPDLYTAEIRTCLVRNGPSFNYSVIGQMEDGTAVTVLDKQGSYYKIDCYDMTGYIAISQVAQRENGTYFIQCDPDSSHTGSITGRTVADTLLLRSAILELTREQLGDPYVFGAQRPGAFDCSGLTYYVFGQNGYRLARGASGQMQNSLIISQEGLQVGDLIFFRSAGSPYLASHVGIYVGSRQIIHAGNSGVCYADLDSPWFAENYLCARRIITVSTRTMERTSTVTVESLLTNTPTAGIRTAG